MRKALRTFSEVVMLVLVGVTLQAQPVRITQIPDRSTDFLTAGNFVYFTSSDSLLRSDGTATGTVFLRSGFPSALTDFTEFNSMLFFISGNQLWRSDGTPGGTIQLTAKSQLNILSGIGTTLFFQGSDAATGLELYRTIGTTGGTALVKDINPGPGNGFVGASAVVGSNLFFGGNDGINGNEPWKTNGTATGTVMIEDISPGTGHGFAGGSYSYNNLYYFIGNTPASGQEPWVSDGSAAGSFMLRDIVPGAADPVWIRWSIGHDGAVYFITRPEEDPSTGEATATLWKTSGTTASTVALSSLLVDETGDADVGVTYGPFRIYNGKVYFFATPYHGPSGLWVSDGTPSGTHRVYSMNNYGGSGSGLNFFEVVNGYMLFYGFGDESATYLYRSDGTTEGTAPWFYFNSAGFLALPRDLTVVGDLLFYGDHANEGDGYGGASQADEYFHLFQADGVTRKSMLDLYGVSTIGTQSIVDYNGKVIFSTRDDQDYSTDKQKYLWIYDPATEPSEQVGKIQQEVWSNVTGTKVSSIPVNSEPSSVNDLNIFETATNAGDNYGSRIRGYVSVPQTGDYIFWIASDDQSQLWLSTDDNPANKREIAEVTGWTSSRQWDKYPSQQSAAIGLVAGRTHYIEALHKEGTGADNLAVGWQLPEGRLERPIPGKRLIAFNSEPPAEPCAGAGMIRQEFWTNVPGTQVSAIPTDTDPDLTQDLTMFEGPATNVGDNYGSRIRGFVCPPATGPYIFWIAGDDQVELWLSTDDNPANKRRIAYHTGWTNKRQWTKYSTQHSAVIELQSNQRYYIEALMKEGSGGDHVSVGWQLPDGVFQRPIAGAYLIPFESEPPACAGTGTISVETWRDIDGTRVSSIPLETAPDLVGERNIFEAPTNAGNNFGSRFRGYICAPATGNYTFWIASDDRSELWLSTNADQGNKRLIAHHTGWTLPRQWTKYTTQESASISLVAGQQYYIEALYKEDEGGDNMAVGWQLPDGTPERPIPGNRLSPFEDAASTMSARASSEEELYSKINVYPNPAKSGDVHLTISGYENIEKMIETHIQIINMRGEVVFDNRISCGADCSSYLMNINKQLVPGVYVVKIQTDGVRSVKRLLVK